MARTMGGRQLARTLWAAGWLIVARCALRLLSFRRVLALFGADPSWRRESPNARRPTGSPGQAVGRRSDRDHRDPMDGRGASSAEVHQGHGGRLVEDPPPWADRPVSREGAVVERWWRAVDTAARNTWPWSPASCLPRALVLHRLLRRTGIASTLRIGVRRTGDPSPPATDDGPRGGLHAHAWIEWRGIPVGEPPDLLERFASLAPAEHLGSSVDRVARPRR